MSERPEPGEDALDAGSSPPSTPQWSRGHALGLEYHRGLLDDTWRMDAYERAIRARVKPGMVVLDLGSGSGLLAMLAARRGARVHAVESMPIARLARRLVEHNGLADRVTVHQRDIATMAPVEPVDLIISEFMGRFLVDDGMLPLMPYAGAWLREGGGFCPSVVELKLAPAGDFRLYAIDSFAQTYYGLDFSPAQVFALHHGYHVSMTPGALMAPATLYHTYTPPEVAAPFDRTMAFTLTRGGRLQGLVGWFEASLAPGISLSTGPGIESHWGQYLLPLPPQRVEAGARIEVRLWLETSDTEMIWRWAGRVIDGDRVAPFELESAQRLTTRALDAGGAQR